MRVVNVELIGKSLAAFERIANLLPDLAEGLPYGIARPRPTRRAAHRPL